MSKRSLRKSIHERCTGCGMCETVCPHGVFSVENGKARSLDIDACMECGACAENCPREAVSVRAGVGCAVAIINGALGKTAADSDCCVVESEDSCCG